MNQRPSSMTTDNDESSVDEKNIKIYVRILPLERFCESCAKIDTERKKIYIRCLQEMQPNRIVKWKKPSYWCFRADGIFCDSSQEEVFRVSTEDVVTKILDGVSCVLMGYGQTGTGKSFTISGLRNNWEHRGLVARLLSRLFAEKTKRKKVSKIEYGLSFIELYGRDVKDLLVPDMDSKVKINEHEPFKEISIMCMENEKEGLQKIFEGEVRRSAVKGRTYPVSHLSTAVITFHVSNMSLITSWGVVTTAKIHIVEAAGTGTVGRDNSCKTATDMGMANLMKTQLEQHFSYMGNPSSCSNPIRSSNLLKILGDAFSVSSIIRFISHIRITKEDLDITLSTLRFTAKIARLKPVKLKEDVKYRSDLMVYKLQKEVNALERELILNDMFLRQEPLAHISIFRLEQINRSVLQFLNNKITDFTLFSVSQVQVLLESIKNLYNRLTEKELETDKLKETYENLVKSVSEASTPTSLSKEPVLSADAQINNQKRIRGSSQVEAEDVKKEAKKEEVGNLDKTKTGMTLGPYPEESHLEDNRGKRTPTEQILKIDKQNMFTVRQLFKSFLKEEADYAKIKETFDRNEKTLAAIRQRCSTTIDNYFEAKRNLDDARDKLSKHQQIRQVLEVENRRGNEVFFEAEKTVERDILCHQKVLVNLEEEVNQLQFEISKLSNGHLEMSSKIEYGFREYCKRRNYLLHYTDKSMKTFLAPVEKESLDAIRRKYNKFQRAMLRKTEETERSKKVRLEYKRRCNSANV